MFKVIHKNTNKEIKCLSRQIQYNKNRANILTINLGINSNFYNKFRKYLDYIQVINIKDNTIVFDGRVINVFASMSETGAFTNKVVCESILNYFNDTNVGKWELHPLEVPDKAPSYAIPNSTVKIFLNKLLDNHNSKVADKKKIYLGNIEIDSPVYIKTNYESSLAALISKVLDRHDGYLIIRNEDDKNYLDLLINNPIKEIQKIELGINMKSINIDDSNVDIFTRIIPLGKDELTIKSVNDGLMYVEDKTLVQKYGVIEKVMKWENVTLPQNLLNKAKEVFSQVKLNADGIKLTALDLSYLNSNYNLLKLNTPVRAINKVLNYDNTHEIVSILLDLDYPFKSTFDLNIASISANNNVSSIVEQSNNNKVEIVSMGDKIESKVSSDDFNSYKTQTADKIEDVVKSTDGKLESYRTQTATEITDKVSDLNNQIESVRLQTASKIQDSVTDMQNQISSIQTQTASEIDSKVADIKNQMSSLETQTSSQIQSKVEDLNNQISSIETQTSNQISFIVQQVNGSSSEISQLADKIDSVVKQVDGSSSEQTQTSSQIQSKVQDLNNQVSSMETQLSNEISQKVSSSDVSSIFDQKMNQFDFTIGGNTPLSIKQNELDMNFSDGSKCEISEDGFYYITADGKHAYHSLYHHDSITKVHSGDQRTITVPEEFRGKDYKIAYWLGNVFSENAGDCMNSYSVELVDDNRDNLTFTIKVSIMMFNPRTETSPYWRGFGNIVYTILA